MSTDAPAGWYPDPDGSGSRWWDGTTWTVHEHDPVPTHWLDDDAATSLAFHLVARFRHKTFRSDTKQIYQWKLHSHADLMRTGTRAAVDGLRRVIPADETVVLLDDWYRYDVVRRPHHVGIVEVVVTALTTRRAFAETVTTFVATGEMVVGQVEHAPLPTVEIDRQRLLGMPGAHLRRKRAGGFELSSKDADVIQRIRAFVAHPTPAPFPELAELLALPRLDPQAPAPDWYPDPTADDGGDLHRWWDGFRWTEETARRGEYYVDYD